jgi:hypothetical protein
MVNKINITAENSMKEISIKLVIEENKWFEGYLKSFFKLN